MTFTRSVTKHMLIEDLYVGQTFHFTRTLTQTDLEAMVNITGDEGGYHVDETFAKAAGFRTLITPGMLQASLMTKIGGDLNFLAHQMHITFLKPVYAGDTLACVSTVTAIDPVRRRIALLSEVTNQDDIVVVSGDVTGYFPKPEWGAPRR